MTSWSSWSRPCSICTGLSPEPGRTHERTLIARRIEATDRQIDALVYELYGLTEEEIGIVEAASR
ncbi:MAG: hypothetical protein ACP5OU_10255 [Methanothrix sp.]